VERRDRRERIMDSVPHYGCLREVTEPTLAGKQPDVKFDMRISGDDESH
jgi:hypothetical protein